jgi:phosphatidylglycerophosphate synthase
LHGERSIIPATEDNRRPIRARSSAWAQAAARWLAASRVTPNQISVASVACACAAAAGLLLYPGWTGLLVCAAGIQARLACNLLDGMVAVEGRRSSPLGQLYNEFPDRIADSVLIVALGYAAGAPWLGWLGALLAALTAYVRAFGAALGQPQDFRGPMAKQHRMATMTAGCLAGAVEAPLNGSSYALTLAAGLIAAGSLATCITRTRAIAARLNTN